MQATTLFNISMLNLQVLFKLDTLGMVGVALQMPTCTTLLVINLVNNPTSTHCQLPSIYTLVKYSFIFYSMRQTLK